MAYFENFPLIDYYFGNKVKPVKFTDMNVYVDLIDQIKDDVASYTYYDIMDGDRPDQVSQYLYDTPEFYWTFYLMNDSIRLHGWPLSDQQVTEKAKKDYPNTVIITNDNLSDVFKKGTEVHGRTSGARGTVVTKRLDLNQLIISKTDSLSFVEGEVLEDVSTAAEVIIGSVVLEYNAVHHILNSQGDYVDANSSFAPSISSNTKYVLYDTTAEDYNLDTIYDTMTLANANAEGDEVGREVTFYTVINNDGQATSNTPSGFYYYNPDTSQYELYNNISTYVSSETDYVTDDYVPEGFIGYDDTQTFSTEAAAQNYYSTQLQSYIKDNFNTLTPVLFKPVTFLERVKDQNDAKLQLKVIKPDVINQVINSYNQVVLESQDVAQENIVTRAQQGLGIYTATAVSG